MSVKMDWIRGRMSVSEPGHNLNDRFSPDYARSTPTADVARLGRELLLVT